MTNSKYNLKIGISDKRAKQFTRDTNDRIRTAYPIKPLPLYTAPDTVAGAIFEILLTDVTDLYNYIKRDKQNDKR